MCDDIVWKLAQIMLLFATETERNRVFICGGSKRDGKRVVGRMAAICVQKKGSENPDFAENSIFVGP